jgi:hypothetical protein
MSGGAASALEIGRTARITGIAARRMQEGLISVSELDAEPDLRLERR